MKNRHRIILLLLVIHLIFLETQAVYAAMKNNGMITITEKGQVIDTITYNGVTVDAIYTYESYAGNDTTYSCAAFVKKFYKAVYGISVYNLNSTSSTPLIYDSTESFHETSTPQVGDIIRDNSRTHWAIVKQIIDNKIIAIQQSYKTGSTAFIEGTIELEDKGFTYFTYSKRIDNATTSDNIDSGQDIDADISNDATEQTEQTVQTVQTEQTVQTKEISSDQVNQEPVLPKVTVSKKTLYTGYKSYTLKFEELESDAVLTFSSSDESIAKINSKGKITPVGEGITFITVQIAQQENTYQYTVTVTVKKPYIKMTKIVKQLLIGETTRLSAELKGMEGPITWSTSDETVAAINSMTGELYGIKKGTVDVSASCNGIVTTYTNVKIK